MIQSYAVRDKHHSRDQNGPFVLNKDFLVQTIGITLIYLLALFLVQNVKKILAVDPELWRCTISGPKMVHLPQTKFFFKIINIILIYLLAHFILQNLKKFFQLIQSYEDVQFLGPKWPIPPNHNFFRKSVYEPCFFYSFPSTCQKLKTDINLWVKYWWLINTEISLADSHICL